MKVTQLSGIAVAVCAAMSSSPSWSQEQVFTLGEIVVAEQHGVREIAMADSLSAEQIALVGAKTAAEALDYVPGVHMAQSSRGEAFITMQGFEQDKILVLLDGVPYYETNNGQLDLNQIPASIIAKIEVTKGASSVLYGPNGMGGVVNIVTHKGQQGQSGSLEAAVGQYGQNYEAATLNMGSNGFSLFGALEHRGRDSMRLSNDYDPQLSVVRDRDGISGLPREVVVEDGGKRENSDLDSTNLWLRGGYSNETSEIYASVFRLDTERGVPYNTRSNRVFSDFSTFADFSEYRDSGIDLSGRHQLNDWISVRMLAYYHTHRDGYRSYSNPQQSVVLSDSGYSDYTGGGALFTDMQLADWHRLSMSLNYKNDVHKSNNEAYQDPDRSHGYERSELDTLSIAVEDNLQLGNWTLISGVAWHRQEVAEDRDRDTDGQNSSDTLDPMVGFSYRTGGFGRVYGSVAKKTRFATFREMYDRSTRSNYHDLKPERSVSYALGWQHAPRLEWLSNLDLGLFYHDISDKIESSQDEQGNDIYGNIGKSEFYGVELALTSRLSDHLTLDLDYTYTHARNLSEERESEHFRDIPENAVTAILTWQEPAWDLESNLRARYRNNILIRDYDRNTRDRNVWEDSVLTLDWGVRKYFGPALSAYLNVNNLLDEFHFEGYGQPNEGRSFEVGASWRF